MLILLNFTLVYKYNFVYKLIAYLMSHKKSLREICIEYFSLVIFVINIKYYLLIGINLSHKKRFQIRNETKIFRNKKNI